METHPVSVVRPLFACIAIVLLAACSKGTDEPLHPIPGIGQEVPLASVDGKTLPTIIASSASDQTVVVSGKATLGEAIASGQYAISLRHSMGATADTSTASGTVVFAWTEATVTATIDLGGSLGIHTFVFSR